MIDAVIVECTCGIESVLERLPLVHVATVEYVVVAGNGMRIGVVVSPAHGSPFCHCLCCR
jgi:hypothetical protein